MHLPGCPCPSPFPATALPGQSLCFPALGALLLGAAYGYPLLTGRLLELSLAGRCLATVALVAPIGFFLGIPFPTGLSRKEAAQPGVVPWLWGINGGSTVFGSVLAILLAMEIGFTAVLALGAAAYLAAFLTLPPAPTAGAAPPR